MVTVLPSQLSRLLSRQACSVIVKQQQHMPSLLPTMLRTCIFHLSRISSSAVTRNACSRSFHQSVTFVRGLSKSAPSCAAKKSTDSKVGVAAGKETCQVFDQREMLVGQMTVNEAEALARKDSLRLMDMGVNADGLRSFRLISGRELAEESKRLKMEKKKSNEKLKEKEFRITSKITDHDLEIKLRQAKDVLNRGAHVKLVITAHRRTQQAEADRVMSQLLKKVTQDVQDQAVVKQGVRSPGEQQLLLRPLPSGDSSSKE